MVSTSAACSEAGVYAYPYANHVFLRDISKDGESTQTVLTLMGSVSPDMLVNFSIEHPDVAVVSAQTLNSSEIQQAALSGNDSIDLFVVSAPVHIRHLKRRVIWLRLITSYSVRMLKHSILQFRTSFLMAKLCWVIQFL